MDEEEKGRLASVLALHDLCSALLGKIEVVQVTQDALLGPLVRTFPPMLEPIQNNMRMLAATRAQNIRCLRDCS
jgi:ribosomal protein S12 methylthiotransferase accessory factor YcaO